MKVTTNKGNWSGEMATVNVNVTKKSFKYQDYTFTIRNVKNDTMVLGDGKYTYHFSSFDLFGCGWGDDEPLATINNEDKHFDLEYAVVQAIRYVSNHV